MLESEYEVEITMLERYCFDDFDLVNIRQIYGKEMSMRINLEDDRFIERKIVESGNWAGNHNENK
jgi:hypothetical protein